MGRHPPGPQAGDGKGGRLIFNAPTEDEILSRNRYAGGMGVDKPTGRDLVPGFAETIRAAREAKGLTLRELADATGGAVSMESISRLEREERAPSLRVAAALAHALGLKKLRLADLHKPAK